MADTPDQAASEKIGRAIDGQIFKLNAERAILIAGPARIVEIDAELAVLQNEKVRIDPRRPVIVVAAGGLIKVDLADVNTPR